MVDIVYILGPNSKWDNNELKYSIRSVLKHVKNYGTIWIVGFNPNIELDAPTRFIPVTPRSFAKIANIRAALKEISLTEECSERFIYMNDDFFFIQDVDAETMPSYFRGTLSLHCSSYEKEFHHYWESMCYTWAVLSMFGYSTKDFEVHGPLPMEKSKLAKALTLKGTNSGLQIRSLYANLHGGPMEYMQDCKVGLHKDPDLNLEKMFEAIKGRQFFSIGDELTDECKAVFEELYPKIGDKTYAPTPYQPALDRQWEEFAYCI